MMGKSVGSNFRMLMLFSGLAALSGCSAGPDFVRPEVPRTDHYRSSGEAAVSVVGGNQELVAAYEDGEWWKAFGSPCLDTLVGEALAKSPTLEAARATLRVARYRYEAQAGSSGLPGIELGGGASRQEANMVMMGFDDQTRTFNMFDSFISLGYTLDLSGANRRRLEALAAKAEEARFQLQAAQLNLVATVTVTAIQLAELNERHNILEGSLALLEKKKALTASRFIAGELPRYDLLSVDKEVSGVMAELAMLRRRREATALLLGLLSGREPAERAVPEFSLVDFSLPATLPMRVPSVLVRKRPDILASEAMMREANAEYGAKLAESYPVVMLDAHIGSQALSLSSLFGSSATVWGFGGGLAQSLFDGGRHAEQQAALASFDLAAANYRQTVLEALGNVADMLVALEADSRELAALQEIEGALDEQYRIVQAQRQSGTASMLELLQVSLEKEALKGRLATSRSRRLVDTALFFQSMGG